MAAATSELVDVVDEGDMVVGSSSLSDCLQRGTLHRAVAVLVWRGRSDVLLQQRSKSDDWQPGLWTLSCTGHVKKGESYEDAAKRELAEELGISPDVRLDSKTLLPPIRCGSLTEREWTALFVAHSDGRITADPVELEGVKEVGLGGLRQMTRRGELTEDAAILLAKYFGARLG